jgi:hypothetical protein
MQANDFYQQALKIKEKQLEPGHMDVASYTKLNLK